MRFIRNLPLLVLTALIEVVGAQALYDHLWIPGVLLNALGATLIVLMYEDRKYLWGK